MLVWKCKYPPIYVDTFEVRKTCQYLKPYFEYFRNNLIYLDGVSPSSSFSRTVAPYSQSKSKLERLSELFKDWHNRGMAAYPRGSLDAELVICGIAPGYTVQKYYESMWLLGPSSKLLYMNLLDTSSYFTNICKASFKYNKYSEADIAKWFESFYEELEILQPRVVVFLGKYKVYHELRLPSSIQKVQVYHPSFFLRRQDYDRGSVYIREALKLEVSKDKPDLRLYKKAQNQRYPVYIHNEFTMYPDERARS